MTDKERLEEVLKYFNTTANAFAKRLGLGNAQVFYDIIKGRNGISKDLAEKISANCLIINKAWLLTGEGSMFDDQVKDKLRELGGLTRLKADADLIPKAVPADPFDGDAIPLLETSIEAGVLKGFAESQIKNLLPHYKVPGFKGSDFLATVSGDSMTDRYWPGDVVGCKIVTSSGFIQWGKVHVLDTTQGGLLKKIMPSEIDGFIKAVSFNEKNYPSFDIPKTEITGMALVVGVVRLV